MASALYEHGREHFADGVISWSGDDIKLVLCDEADYVVDLVNDDFYDDVTAAGRVAVSGNFAAKTFAAGVVDADNIVFGAVAGDVCESLTCFMDTGNEATSPVICNIDDAAGLPVDPNGGDINVTWDNGANKIFKL